MPGRDIVQVFPSIVHIPALSTDHCCAYVFYHSFLKADVCLSWEVLTTELVSLKEASGRTLVALGVDGWKYRFNIINTHIHAYVRPNFCRV